MHLLRVVRRALRIIDRGTNRRLAAIAGLNVFASGLDLLAILLLVPFLSFLGTGSLQAEALPGPLADALAGAPDPIRTALLLALVATGLFLIKGFSSLMLLAWQTSVLNHGQTLIAGRILRAYAAVPWSVQQQIGTGSLMRTVSGSTQSVMMIITAALTVAADAAVFASVVVALLVIDPWLAIGSVSYLLVAGLLYLRVVRDPVQRRGRLVQEELERMNTSIYEFVGGAKEIAVRGTAKSYVDRYLQSTASYLAATRLITVANSGMRVFLETLLFGGALAVIVVVLVVSRSGADVLVSLGVLLAGGLRLVPALNSVLLSVNVIRSNEPAVGLAERELVRLGLRDPSRELLTDRSMPVESGGIALRRVSYTYPERAVPALRDIDLSVAEGEAVGVVGPSGAGKTTLMDLLLGLLEPTSGEVLVGGIPLATCSDVWRSRIGFVPQEIFLFDDTLAANIAFAGPDGAMDRGCLDEAIRLAHLSSVVEGLPDGPDTRLGERGVRLSGGQRQRVGLARALYRRPSVLFLDEATSALDNEAEAQIGEALRDLHGQLTIVVIAHRLSTVQRCDRILYMEDGEVVGDGPFAELASSCAGFGRLVELGSLRGTF
ncbi:MAG: hypothetical protein RL190_1344 [Actinomycetota bacterium]